MPVSLAAPGPAACCLAGRSVTTQWSPPSTAAHDTYTRHHRHTPPPPGGTEPPFSIHRNKICLFVFDFKQKLFLLSILGLIFKFLSISLLSCIQNLIN